jgi:hypothetical protein
MGFPLSASGANAGRAEIGNDEQQGQKPLSGKHLDILI